MPGGPSHGGRSARGWPHRLAIAGLLSFIAVSVGACGPADADSSSGRAHHDQGSSALAHHGSHEAGVVKATRWSIIKVRGQSVRLFAFVPYCGYERPKPHVERVTKKRRRARLVLTMFVWYPPRPLRGGCIFVDIGIMSSWVRLGKTYGQIQLYDGKTSPPEPRSSPKHGFP